MDQRVDWMNENPEMKQKNELYYLIEEAAKEKREQRLVEEQIFPHLTKPVYKKWIHERIMNQYKHERILKDIAKMYLGKEIQLEISSNKVKLQSRVSYEIEKRLEDTYQNIELISSALQATKDFKIYKMLNAVLCDEQLYCSQLTRMLYSQ